MTSASGTDSVAPPQAEKGETDAAVPPVSASHFGVSLIALFAGLGLLATLQWRQPQDSTANVIGACALIAALIAAYDLYVRRVWRLPSAGIEGFSAARVSLARVAVKLLGLAATLGTVALAYWLFPEYHGGFYAPYWRLLRDIAPWGLLAALPYFWWMDGALREPRDAYWHLGCVLLGRERPDLGRIAQHYGGWAVKGFFLPLMVVYLTQQVDVATRDFQRMTAFGGLAVYDFFYDLEFLIDLMFCVVGYSMTLRLTDSHIRSTEPTALGWIVALVCYQPFWSLVENGYLRYDRGYPWGPWLAQHPLAQALWGAAILALLAVYALCTVSFGLRFSNLTHRGIITAGPYRWLKHPAYLTKNLSWWLIAVPFVPRGDWGGTLRACALLGLVNLIYFLRAFTEERHLSRDPDYRAYCAWIARHGLWARLGLRRLLRIGRRPGGARS
ncbi:MAG: isoprenylcysteine carboxylmethyltransferase family protein [Sinobacteraceae bacterium]|nr:isoprenylcysteine carboxylmethyltransferase family protein [Nevskiaceae bacterium]